MLISMGLRGPTKMVRTHFDFNDVLSTVGEDVNDNPYLSQEFSMLSRSTLAQLFCVQLRLSLIAIMFPLSSTVRLLISRHGGFLSSISER